MTSQPTPTPYRVTAPHSGDAHVLRTETFTPPSPKDEELLVRVAAAGVNFIDTYQRSGVYHAEYPLVLGSEGSGTVIEVGQNVTQFVPGDRIMWHSASGSYASHVTVPAASAYRVPDNAELPDAASIPLQGLTAHYLATNSYAITPHDIVLIHAGAGGVGLLLTQIASLLGAHIITTVSTADKAELSQRAGAHHVIRYDTMEDLTTELPRQVREITKALRAPKTQDSGRGLGVDAVYDGVGKATFAASLASLRTRGTLVLFGGASGQVPPFNLQDLNTHGSLSVTRPSLGHFVLTRSELESRYTDLLTWQARGQLDFRIGRTFPLYDAAQAHIALEQRETSGKVLLLP